MLSNTPLFTDQEMTMLTELHTICLNKTATLSPVLLQKDIARLTIELSWKSSQIEGNTYSLLETELLLSEQKMAEGKKEEEAIILLNHKRAMDYLYDHRISLTPLKVSVIEDVHSVLIDKLGVSRNLRKRIVHITGTTYTPPDNEFQIRGYLEQTCTIINSKIFIYEKALLAILMISLIHPFEDGNKRTGRITGNGLLIENNYCPLSYRSVKADDYKKAMILFYEQANVSAFKKNFLKQAAFAANNYF